ncbi:MAG: ABC transporter ATP-binding protein [Chloroflexi bacterium]|nr:ABC transporter ATP-binding protein [Chloroflexota bacterium]
MSFLSLVDVSKRYRTNGSELVALEGLNLAVEESEFVVLLGPSGCGKSTLLQIVAGLEQVSSGQVTLRGRPVTGWGSERTCIFQRAHLFPWLTALENVAFGLRLTGHPKGERLRLARASLARMGLDAASALYPHELSGGMQQRVALARALVLDPAVLLMDEPLASVDALLRSRLQREIRASCRGKTVLFVTHSIREALVLADRLVILSARPGRVRHELRLGGEAPRSLSSSLIALEEQIERELLEDAAETTMAPQSV